MRHATTRQVLIGLGLALVLCTLLIGGVRSTAQRTMLRGGTEQIAVVSASAVTEVLDRTRQADGDVQATALALTERLKDVDQIRVIDSGRRQLVASTNADDIAAGELPRRLKREQKAWFDQATELAGNHRTNVDEGNARRDMVLRSVVAEASLELVRPLFTDGEVKGSVQVLTRAVVPTLGVAVPTWVVLAVALAFLLILAWWVRGRRLFLVGLVVVVLAVAGYTALSLDQLRAVHETLELRTAVHAYRVWETVRDLSGPDLDITQWNVDRLGAPRGTYDTQGVALAEVLDAGFAQGGRRFVVGSSLLGLLVLVFYYWVGAGWALRTGQALSRHRTAYGFVLPAMIGMILLVFFPFGYGVAISFTNQTLYNVNQPLYELWNGVENYVDILSDFDLVRTAEDGTRLVNYQNFYWTLMFTILWTVSNVTIGVTLGLILALILNTKNLALRPFYRIILILPWAVPNYITALIWKGMFHRQFGVINQLIAMFGGEPIAWFDAWHTSFFAVLATNGWLSFPFMMVVSLGALQAISNDLYEAARVDGASRWQQFWYVTLPSIKPALVPAVILSVVWTFNMFNIIYLVSQGQPAGATEILITDAYKIAFEQYRYGYAAAYSVVIFLILMVYGVWQNRVTRATEGI